MGRGGGTVEYVYGRRDSKGWVRAKGTVKDG
jgi:hypothetical protein